jgi:hypothetical protein
MRALFFVILVLFSFIDALLIAKPNFLGKLGLWLFKYSYLRTFPRAMLTVSVVVCATLVISESIVFIARKNWIAKSTGAVFALFFILFCGGLLAKIILDFSKGVYSHTGIYFKIGVHLLPGILIFIFVTSLFRMLSKREQ